MASNAIATGMDFASLAPEVINARRGALLLAVIAIALCPWNLVNSPSTFITVVGSLGIFISPLMGVFIADYLVVRRQVYKVPDLYIGNKTSIYWYQYGFHWRAFLTWISLIWMSLRECISTGNLLLTVTNIVLAGFAGAIGGYKVATAWTRIFKVSFLIGMKRT